eukprot:CAMPEP_0171570376 /NCGR_PEP_ID=MMETSP0961-20121227/2918_1 /TAXON_ID=87120 /ORGANISM="Aurantiochytrium limacinum, Strain ATCCMYA-1381" /LENGTH=154 /DNA_ID=CAMNT_0012124875 /DNA_START=75 /DNA_END=536 /DNA_ORIENTATION=-
MSLYIDVPVAAPNVPGVENESKDTISSDKIFRTSATSWCKSENILAIAGEGRGVWFVNEEGELIAGADLVRSSRNSEACVLDWRVRSKVLAAGWDDGAVTLWNVKDRILKEDTSPRQCYHSNVLDSRRISAPYRGSARPHGTLADRPSWSPCSR